MSILIVAEHADGALSPALLNTVSAAVAIGGDIHVLVAGKDCDAVAKQAAAVDGVAKVLVADDELYASALAEPLAALVAKLADGYGHVLAAASKSGKNLLPRVAALLDVSPITEISAVVSPDTFERPIYAGNAIATVQTADKVKVVSVRPTSFDPASAEGGSAAVETVGAAEDPGLSTFVGQELTKSERPELTGARVVISGGRGMQSGDNFKLLEGIADELNAAIGASRAAVRDVFAGNYIKHG